MTPTNLTDEGLKKRTANVLKQLQVMPWCRCADQTNEDGYLCDYCVIFLELQQVRDAAKKEEREACAKVAEKQEKGFWLGHKVLPDVATLTIIATAIRQMEVSQ